MTNFGIEMLVYSYNADISVAQVSVVFIYVYICQLVTETWITSHMLNEVEPPTWIRRNGAKQ